MSNLLDKQPAESLQTSSEEKYIIGQVMICTIKNYHTKHGQKYSGDVAKETAFVFNLLDGSFKDIETGDSYYTDDNGDILNDKYYVDTREPFHLHSQRVIKGMGLKISDALTLNEIKSIYAERQKDFELSHDENITL